MRLAPHHHGRDDGGGQDSKDDEHGPLAQGHPEIVILLHELGVALADLSRARRRLRVAQGTLPLGLELGELRALALGTSQLLLLGLLGAQRLELGALLVACLLYTSPSPRDA